MQKQRRSGLLMGAPILMCGLILLSACAHPIPATQRQAAVGVPVVSNTIFVGRMEGEFGREMREAVGAETAKSQRYRMVDAEDAADFVLSGGIHLNLQQLEAPPAGWVRLLSRASGSHVWQYTYRDQRTGNELLVPSAQQQVKTVARQVVAQLLTVASASSASANASY